jgi:hypothetical protein
VIIVFGVAVVPQQENFVLWLPSRPLGKLLRWGKAPIIAAMSEPSALFYQRSLWKQAGRKMDVATRHTRETLSFWILSRPFTLVARNLEGARDHSHEWIKCTILPAVPMEASGPKKGLCYQATEKTLMFWLLSRPFPLAARVMEGAQDHSYEWIKGGILPVNTMGASGRKIGRHYQPRQRHFVVLVTFTTFHARCSDAGGRPRLKITATSGYRVESYHWTL